MKSGTNAAQVNGQLEAPQGRMLSAGAYSFSVSSGKTVAKASVTLVSKAC